MKLRPLLQGLHRTVCQFLASTVVKVDSHIRADVEKLALKLLHLRSRSNHRFGVLLTDALNHVVRLGMLR